MVEMHVNDQNSNVSPVCLPWNLGDPGRVTNPGDKTLVSGWGRITNNPFKSREDFLQYSVSSKFLNKVELDIEEDTKCEEVAQYNNYQSSIFATTVPY